ncbi:ATP-binding cassette domain-containing protein [Miniphocaeibacter massiliensis]|uniref:ATP-binding cassette domain-containing protein n=1 Tax=Miniphocaeibacter massiliensis TaxID=2041841 RepID=UPI002413DF24|nr:ATP-binding cassette domain-containing protein [Miniphocaeibacter massiliensis]
MSESINYSKGLKEEVFLYNREEVLEHIIEKLPLNGNSNNLKNTNCNTNLIVEAKNIGFSYNKHKIFNNLNLEIREGDSLAIIGHNGAGKSTLFNTLLGLNKRYEGKINFLGKDIKKIKKGKFWERVGISFQNPELQFITLTVYDEIGLGLKKIQLFKKGKRENNLRIFRYF